MGKSTQEQDTRLLILKKEVAEHRIRRELSALKGFHQLTETMCSAVTFSLNPQPRVKDP